MYIRNLEDPNSKIHKVNVKEVTLKNTSDIVKEFINASFYKTSQYASQMEYRILTHKLEENKLKI